MAVPEKIGKYEVVKQLGEGAMGFVLKARDLKINRDVAIKGVHKHLLDADVGNEVKQRFIHEVQAVGQLRHPNIVAIYETDEYLEEGSETPIPYFVMEFVEGRELDAILKAGERFSQENAVNIVRQILQAFDYTHKHGIIHRDIKPANIFITDSGEVKIADFGIAKIENSELTQMGSVLGTPNYMSPEQCAGQVIDNRSDLFSIAIVFYELLTGEKPFQGNSLHAIMHKIVNSIPEAPSSMNPAVSTELDTVILKALSKLPEQRYQTAGEFLHALLSAIGERQIERRSKPRNEGSQFGSDGSHIKAPLTEQRKTAANTSDDATVIAGANLTKPQDDDKTVVQGLGLTDFKFDEPSNYEKTQLLEDNIPPVRKGSNRLGYVLTGFMLLITVVGGVYWYFNTDDSKIGNYISELEKKTKDSISVAGGIESSDKKLSQPKDNLSAASDTIKTNLSAQEVSKVQKLLKVAEINEKTGRLIWPPTSNAVYIYRLALKIDPNNHKAQNSIQRIADKLVAKAEELKASNDIKTLQAHLEVCLESFPKHARLRQMQDEIGKGL